MNPGTWGGEGNEEDKELGRSSKERAREREGGNGGGRSTNQQPEDPKEITQHRNPLQKCCENNEVDHIPAGVGRITR